MSINISDVCSYVIESKIFFDLVFYVWLGVFQGLTFDSKNHFLYCTEDVDLHGKILKISLDGNTDVMLNDPKSKPFDIVVNEKTR